MGTRRRTAQSLRRSTLSLSLPLKAEATSFQITNQLGTTARRSRHAMIPGATNASPYRAANKRQPESRVAAFARRKIFWTSVFCIRNCGDVRKPIKTIYPHSTPRFDSPRLRDLANFEGGGNVRTFAQCLPKQPFTCLLPFPFFHSLLTKHIR
jgi:hypothetical protein